MNNILHLFNKTVLIIKYNELITKNKLYNKLK